MDVTTGIEWRVFNKIAISDPNAIHIFKLEIDTYSDKVGEKELSILSVAEQNKSNRFLRETDKIRYMITKHALRHILSTFTLIPPRLIEFDQKANKKPAINGIEFNVTHSENLILIAVSSFAVGIDIEYVNPDFDFSPLIDSCFNIEEQIHIKSAKDFYLLWTRKEALLKNTGEGLSDQLNEVTCMDCNTIRHGIEYEIKSFSTGQYIFSLSTVYNQQQLQFWNFC
jgi:4'-phosphopantetheinyl transferase